MTSDNEDLIGVIEGFEEAEKSDILHKKIRIFADAINLSKDLIDEYPELKDKIQNIRKANIRSILLFLSTKRPDIGPGEFIELILIFLNKAKQETREVINEKPFLQEYLVEFASLWAETTQDQIRELISSELQI